MNISILGSGLMGRDIGILFTQSKEIETIDLIVTHSDFRSKEKELRDYFRSLSDQLKTKHDVSLYKKIAVSDSFKGIRESNLIIESVSEDIAIKEDVIDHANKFVNNKTIFCTNTSSLSIEKLSKLYKYPNQLIGLHFFNPAIKSKLIELAYFQKSQLELADPIIKVLENLGRKILIIKDYPGYIINRLLLSQINEALSILEDKVASPEEIDTSFKIANNSFIGPLGLSDFIGNDVVLAMLDNLYQETKKDKFKAGELLKKMVREDRLGIKTKEGFFKY